MKGYLLSSSCCLLRLDFLSELLSFRTFLLTGSALDGAEGAVSNTLSLSVEPAKLSESFTASPFFVIKRLRFSIRLVSPLVISSSSWPFRSVAFLICVSSLSKVPVKPNVTCTSTELLSPSKLSVESASAGSFDSLQQSTQREYHVLKPSIISAQGE